MDIDNNDGRSNTICFGGYMNDLHFDPFSVSDSRFIANNEDLDPENIYYNDLSLPDSVYLTAESLRKSIERNASNFSIIHVNCRAA